MKHFWPKIRDFTDCTCETEEVQLQIKVSYITSTLPSHPSRNELAVLCLCPTKDGFLSFATGHEAGPCHHPRPALGVVWGYAFLDAWRSRGDYPSAVWYCKPGLRVGLGGSGPARFNFREVKLNWEVLYLVNQHTNFETVSGPVALDLLASCRQASSNRLHRDGHYHSLCVLSSSTTLVGYGYLQTFCNYELGENFNRKCIFVWAQRTIVSWVVGLDSLGERRNYSVHGHGCSSTTTLLVGLPNERRTK